MVPAGVLLAGYTACLFAQCEGRDLWQSALLLPHTVINAVIAGAGSLGIAAMVVNAPADVDRGLAWVLLVAASTSALIVAQDTFGRHPTGQASRAARNLWRDRFAARFWLGALLGLALPGGFAGVFLVTSAGAGVLAAGGACALVGLWLYEDAWVRAGQSVPLS